MTRDQILQLDGPELSAKVARAMGGDVLVVSKNSCHVGYKVGDGFRYEGTFNPHRDMNDVRKIWEWMMTESSDLFIIYSNKLTEIIYGYESNILHTLAIVKATPRQHCQAFLLAVAEVGA